MTARIFTFPSMVKHLDNPPNRIREWRLARGVKQWELAEALGIKQNAISRMENGDRAVSMERYRQVAKHLGVDIGQLLAPEDNRMGLSDAGLQLVRRMATEPQLAPALAAMAEVVTAYDPGPVSGGEAANDTNVAPIRGRRSR